MKKLHKYRRELLSLGNESYMKFVTETAGVRRGRRQSQRQEKN